MKRKILFVLLAVFLLTFVVSAVMLIHVYLEYSKADELYAELQEEFVEKEVMPPPPVQEEGGEQPLPEKTASTPITVNFERLLNKNPDIVGWIYCEDTVINYPVVQAKDNKTYLHADLDGDYLRSGTIFVDYRNQEIGEDQNFLIYGHDMRNNSMFGSLSDYKKQSYYDAHPELYYLTPDGDFRIELLLGVVVNTKDMIYLTNPDKEAFAGYLSRLRKNSTFRSNVDLEVGDRVVTLSTCSYEFDDARYVVVGKLVPLQ